MIYVGAVLNFSVTLETAVAVGLALKYKQLKNYLPKKMLICCAKYAAHGRIFASKGSLWVGILSTG